MEETLVSNRLIVEMIGRRADRTDYDKFNWAAIKATISAAVLMTAL
jgi:hypothetical protein